MGPFKGQVPVFVRLWPVRVRVNFTTAAAQSAILATAGLLVFCSLELREPCFVVGICALVLRLRGWPMSLS